MACLDRLERDGIKEWDKIMSDLREGSFWINLLKKIIRDVLKSLGMRTSTPVPNQHVVPHEEGWAVKGAGNERYTAVYDKQSDAIDRARDIAINYGSSVVIHRKDGSIRDRMSYKRK